VWSFLTPPIVFSEEIHDASQQGDLELAQKILSENPEWWDSPDRSGGREETLC
jgi:hypothetical protein